MTYWKWLAAISIAFLLLERIRPARPAQRTLRPQFANDVFYLAFNGHIWALLTGGASAWLASQADAGLALVSLLPESGWLSGKHVALQFVVYLVLSDFLQWCVHVLLHRVPFLWQFHKVHHSIKQMDWAGNFRFHWMELVVYRSLLYVPLLWLGGDHEPLLAVWVAGSAWGHFNHANLPVSIGPLGYLLNSPRMHLWHHDSSDEGGVAKNYGIVLSVWDYLFRTAYWPRDRAPEMIGYPGDGEMPPGLPHQMAFPYARH